jgi:hypothetical protein
MTLVDVLALYIHGQEPSAKTSKMAGLAETLPNWHDLQNSLKTVKLRLQHPSLRFGGYIQALGWCY